MLTAISDGFAFDTSRISDPEVRDCAERALPSKTARQLQRVEVVGANGFVRVSKRISYWKRSENGDSRILVQVLEPSDDRGVSVLIRDDAAKNIISYMTYSPKIKRVRRVNGEAFFGSILGTDFTYEDFSYFYRVDEREQVKRVDDTVLDDHPMYVLETMNPGEDSNYSLVRFYIDKALCVPMRSDFIALNGSVRKQLIAERDQIKQVDGLWIPFRSTMYDHKLKTHSVFIVEEMDVDPDLDDGLFDIAALRRSVL